MSMDAEIDTQCTPIMVPFLSSHNYHSFSHKIISMSLYTIKNVSLSLYWVTWQYTCLHVKLPTNDDRIQHWYFTTRRCFCNRQ